MSRAPRRSARDAQDKAPQSKSAKTFEHCRSCPDTAICTFEGKCDRPRIGRPSVYSEQIAEIICSRIAGGESLITICKDDDMPSERSVFRWLSDPARSAFRQDYERARETWADAMLERMLAIADDGTNDTARDEEGREKVNHDHIARSKLRVDTLKWAMARMAPKRYGDKLDLTVDDKRLDPDERDAKIADLLGRAAVKPDAATRH